MKVLPFDTDLGKHGDTGTSELDVLAALRDGRAQAGTVGDLVWVNEQAAGRVDPARLEVLWTTPPFDHCMFDALATAARGRRATRSARALVRHACGRTRRTAASSSSRDCGSWMPPREEGYARLVAALDRQGGW